MEARELRIGNLIEYKVFQNPDKWEQIDVHPVTFGRLQMEPARFRPIPLSSEWLEKMGFEKHDYTDDPSEGFYMQKTIDVIGDLATSSDFSYVFDCDKDILRIRTVHEFQNLYFALTGSELEFKQ